MALPALPLFTLAGFSTVTLIMAAAASAQAAERGGEFAGKDAGIQRLREEGHAAEVKLLEQQRAGADLAGRV